MQMSEYMLDIVTIRGRSFRVVYGKRMYRNGELSENTVVSFYDRRYASYEFGENGQFVSDYNPETLLESKGYGLCLNGDYADWTIDGTSMVLVRTWLRQLVYTLESL